MYSPKIARFRTIDRFADKYPNISPYSYAQNNPILFLDVAGDSIDVSELMKTAKGRYVLYQIKKDIRKITGIDLVINTSNNMLVPLGKPKVEGTSSTARDYLLRLISSKEGDNPDVSSVGHLHLRLNNDDADLDTEGSFFGQVRISVLGIEKSNKAITDKGLSSLTYGYGIILLIHEPLHTNIGTFLWKKMSRDESKRARFTHDLKKRDDDVVVKKVNVVRNELNLPARKTYYAPGHFEVEGKLTKISRGDATVTQQDIKDKVKRTPVLIKIKKFAPSVITTIKADYYDFL